MEQFPAGVMTREKATKRGGPSSALRLVGPGEDPRILSTNPDHFFGKPWASVNALAFFALVVASVLAVRFLTIELWHGDMPWVWNLTWLIVPWVVLAPLWSMWIWWQRHRARVSRGREVIAAMVRGTPAERGQAIWVSYDEDPVSWRGLDVLVVAESSGGELSSLVPIRKQGPAFGMHCSTSVIRYGFGGAAMAGSLGRSHPMASIRPTQRPMSLNRQAGRKCTEGMARSISVPACLISLRNIAPVD